MLDAISAAHVGMLQDEMRLQTINQNVSNMQTPGFKSLDINNLGFDEHIDANMNSIKQQMDLITEHRQGTLTESKRSSDLALSGPGFFQVQTPEGVFYMRRGDFHVNAEGELETPTGALLLGQSGVLHVDGHAYTIDHAGQVFIDNQKIDQINVVEFSHPETLTYQGEGLYHSEDAGMSANQSTQILQGYIEQSNVQSVDQMMEMIKTSRHFEISQRIMRTADGLLSSAIHELGEGNV